ncbi:putative lysosomal cobalamin transporter [Glarea lozoyensis 74030]|uniref:Putative lysosomal cobalamin transporter n=1 Tax=Glarea lozoyensis (strain ATCC 74030 / MF5533) TaxID=1104152 RepID=H0EGU3_GLAL7|nr:putative lysosomal cobalamin transporter [Glarea lozoyensis 74030]
MRGLNSDLDAVLCLLVVPFTYFFYEELDDEEADNDRQSFGSKALGALKYTLIFVVLVLILFLVGFFVPVARNREGKHMDLDYFKKLLQEDHGTRALTFSLGFLICIGTLLYVLYTAAGLALLPISFIKSAPSISAPQLSETTASALEQNRERQHQLEARNTGRDGGLPAKDQRELEALKREERTLVRRERLAAEARGDGKSFIVRVWTKTCAIFRPLKLIGGILLLLLGIVIWASMLITGIDKAKNSICKEGCGYILGSSVAGIATIGIRFLWLRIFDIRKGHTSPQALLMATVMLTLIMLAINYSLVMIVAPQYGIYGAQTFCSFPTKHPDDQPDCSNHPEKIKPCTELSEAYGSKNVCTPSVVSTFLNRVTVNFPVFGAIAFWAQFAFLAVFMIVFVTSLFRTPKLDINQFDEDAEADEEEGLLASTGRRFGATWQDIRGKAKNTTSGSGVNNGQSSD